MLRKQLKEKGGLILKTKKEFIVYLLVTVIPVFLSLISLPIYTRIFSPESYGALNLVQTTVTYTVIVATTWLSNSLIRFYAQYKKENRLDVFLQTYLSSAISTSIFVFLGYIAVIYLLGVFNLLTPSLIKLFSIGAPLLMANIIINFAQAVSRVQRKAVSYAIVAISNSVFTLLMGLLLVLVFKFDVSGVVAGSALVSMLLAGILLVILFKNSGKLRLDKKILKEALIYGSPLLVSAFSNWILRFSDRYIIGYYGGVGDIGLYSVPYNIAERTTMLIITAFSLTAAPIIVTAWEKGKSEARDVLEKLLRVLVLFLLPATIGLSLLAKEFMAFFVGKDFVASYYIMPFIAFAIFFQGLYTIYFYVFFLTKKTITISRNILLVGGLNILLNILLIPRYGFEMAALTTLLAYFMLFFITFYQTRRFMQVKLFTTSLLKISLSSFFMGAVVFGLTNYSGLHGIINIVTTALAGIVAYFAALFVTGELEEEIRDLRSFVKKIFRIRNKSI